MLEGGDGSKYLIEASNLAMSHSIYLIAHRYTADEVDAAIKRAWNKAVATARPIPSDIRDKAFLALLIEELKHTEHYILGKRNERPHLYTQLTPKALAARVGGTAEEYE